MHFIQYDFLIIRKKNRAEREVDQSKKALLENSIELQEQKIKALHRNLSLKMDTEKLFLENIKNLKNSKENTDVALKDLQLKVNNLIQIDKRNFGLMNDHGIESDIFQNKLSEEFPDLTNKELKLCQYFRMDLSSKEIASIYSTTTGTIRVYKTKIKYKLKLSKEDDLRLFLEKL
ncbi:helix-turn-helix transcriptional regulator [Chryseobacterium sp. CH21]|uniref:helix-turn-helix transcriptional regulator n=1 Tax=Chryseobacterium sp. CH21 TaxID=713556 RepID=UPI0013E975CB|nr:LuxR C-terminal-related transcriptional regulator [Chryseobacterium sp. CH21]